jgi:hypothetical protein
MSAVTTPSSPSTPVPAPKIPLVSSEIPLTGSGCSGSDAGCTSIQPYTRPGFGLRKVTRLSHPKDRRRAGPHARPIVGPQLAFPSYERKMPSMRRAILAPFVLIALGLLGCGGESSDDGTESVNGGHPYGSVPSRAAQLFLADRVCKGTLDGKHRPPLRPALLHGDRRVIAEANRDLRAAGAALGKFPLPGVRSVASGHIKLADSATPRSLSDGPRFALASLDELRQAAGSVGLPSCAPR